MPVVWEDTAKRSSFSPEEIPSTWADVMDTQQASSFEDLPEVSIARMIELNRAENTANRITKDQADARVKQAGLEGSLKFNADGTTTDALDILMERKKLELERADTLSRAEGGFRQNAARLGVALATGLASPTNVASGYLPIIRGSTYLKALAESSSVLGRTAIRAGVGAAEGAAGQAAIEPILYTAKQQEQADYGMRDSLNNILFGSILGGGLHTTVGGFGELYRSARGIEQPWAGFKGLTVDDIDLVRALRSEISTGKMSASTVALALDSWTPEAREVFFAGLSPQERVRYQTARDRNIVDESQIVNPIDRFATREEKIKQTNELTAANRPVLDNVLKQIDEELGTTSNSDIKSEASLRGKIDRPSVKARKPWYDVEHVRDALRSKTVLERIDQLPAVVDVLERNGVSVVKVDTGKFLTPNEWGFRMAALDLRMPNGQIVEHYMLPREVHDAQLSGHLIYEKWRPKDLNDLTPAEAAEFAKDLAESQRVYQAGWEAALARSGESENAALASVESFRAKAESLTSMRSSNSLMGTELRAQGPSPRLTAKKPSVPRTTGSVPSRNVDTRSIAITSTAIVPEGQLERTARSSLDRISTSELAENASPEVRQAAIETSLNQSLNGEPVDVEGLFAGERGIRESDGADSADVLPGRFVAELWRDRAQELSRTIDERLAVAPKGSRDFAPLVAQRKALQALARGETLDLAQRELVRQAVVGDLIASGTPVPGAALEGSPQSVWKQAAELRNQTALDATLKSGASQEATIDAERSAVVEKENAAKGDDLVTAEKEATEAEAQLKAAGVAPDAEMALVAIQAKQLDTWAQAAELATACLGRGF